MATAARRATWRMQKKRKAAKKIKKRIYKKLNKRKFEGSPERNVRRKTQEATPPPSGSGRRLLRAGTRALSAGAELLGGPAAGMAVSGASAAGEFLYDRFNTKGRGSVKVSNVAGQMSGRITGTGKKVNRTSKIGKIMSPYGFAQKGIALREEFRIQDASTGTNESRFVGHMSLPLGTAYIQMWYAILKQLFIKAGAYVPNLNEPTLNIASTASIKVVYYTSWLSTSLLSKSYTVPNNSTWKALFDGFANWVLTQFEEDPKEIRIVDLEYIPATAYASTDYNRVRINFPQIKIHIKTKSMLKIQNQSSFGGTGQEDDVTNIPVEVSMYYVKGNQFINQNQKKSYDSGYGFYGFDETFAKGSTGSEAPPAYEIMNCTGKDKFILDPGHIKTSIISHSGVYSAQWLLSQTCVLVNTGATPRYWKIGQNTFVSLGHARGIHIDRVIGSIGTTTGDKVRLNTELEFFVQTAAICPVNTATDQYETQN